MSIPPSRSRPWSPYLGGALAGLLVVLSVFVAGKYFGASTTFVRGAGFVESLLAPERVAAMPYFIKEAPKLDWQALFVVGILVGAALASQVSGTFRVQSVPDSFDRRFGGSALRRGAVAFLGGVLAMFGARLADGCPSGHGLSGTLQLSVSGFIALACFFIGGIITARMQYKGR
ncbi:YeeE/YedE family protein [Desulfovibrio aminophilus]|nr:YeeE/YedE thiosulfate transporter family protein [Desulfovibrio aminophilus]MCM0756068.1 YeeE/YedE family protein [Desulfovibrio aminophilus]